MDKLSMSTPNLISENIEKIADLFPRCIVEAEDELGNKVRKVDFDLLKAELWDQASVEWLDERYRLDWPGKKRSILKANTPITKTLRPVKEDSVDWDTTQNLYIEGDNFEVLKILQESYLGKVKMIYIDPPYNTGKDFVYNDNFSQDASEYKEKIEQNTEWYKMVRNMETNGRFHSDWLSMMYERLKIARDLLTDDWVIFISINDYELNNLHKCCDEVFWEKNFLYQLSVVNNLNWNDNSSWMMETQEYCLIYAKNNEKFEMWVLPIEDEENDDWQIDERWYRKLGWSLKATWINAPKISRPNLFFPIYINEDTLERDLEPFNWIKNQFELIPITDWNEMSWYWSKEKFKNERYDVIVKKVSWWYSLYKKQRPSLWDMPSKRGKTTFYNAKYATANSNAELKRIFDWQKVFDYSKSVKFLEDLISIWYANNSIILDFFSWSATTAHACMQLNSQDWWNRKFIMVQIPEDLDQWLKMSSSNTSKIEKKESKELERRLEKKLEQILTMDLECIEWTKVAWKMCTIIHLKQNKRIFHYSLRT